MHKEQLDSYSYAFSNLHYFRTIHKCYELLECNTNTWFMPGFIMRTWIIEATCSRDHRLVRSYKKNRLQSFNVDAAVIYVVTVHVRTWYARLSHTRLKYVLLFALSSERSEIENSSPHLLLRSVITKCSSTNKLCCCSAKLVLQVNWIFSLARTGSHKNISGWKYISGWKNRKLQWVMYEHVTVCLVRLDLYSTRLNSTSYLGDTRKMVAYQLTCHILFYAPELR